jgi:hypothetical protein
VRAELGSKARVALQAILNARATLHVGEAIGQGPTQFAVHFTLYIVGEFKIRRWVRKSGWMFT